MEDAVHAIIMAFSVMVFVIGLTVTVYMFQQTTSTADTLLYYTDQTNFFDNIEIQEEDEQTDRLVDVETIIPTLYRYSDENFCVKICDASGELIQIFDINIEGEVRQAASMSTNRGTAKQEALKKVYNNKNKPVYLFEAPWIGSTDENIKTRIDYFVNGKSGYINNTLVNYEESRNMFYRIRKYNRTATEDNKIYFKENFIRYTYKGDTMTNDDGEILVNGVQPEDKIVIIYTAMRDLT